MSRQRRRITRGIQQALRPLSATYRRKVRQLYTGRPSRFCDHDRELLAAVWAVMNEVEHRRPQYSQVTALRAVYNVLCDDLGANEPHPGVLGGDGRREPARWPHVEAAEQLMLKKRRMSPEQRRAAAERLRKARERR
jgi:hypothetical protein